MRLEWPQTDRLGDAVSYGLLLEPSGGAIPFSAGITPLRGSYTRTGHGWNTGRIDEPLFAPGGRPDRAGTMIVTRPEVVMIYSQVQKPTPRRRATGGLLLDVLPRTYDEVCRHAPHVSGRAQC